MVRNHLEIIYSILKHTEKPIKITNLTTKANLNWTPLAKRYMPPLLEGGFIEQFPVGGKVKCLYVRTLDGRDLMKRIAVIYHDLGWGDKLTGG